MSFYYIDTNRRNLPTTKLLRAACKDRKVEFIEIDSADLNCLELEKGLGFKKGDFLYRASQDRFAKIVERRLLGRGAITFYRSREKGFFDYSSVEESNAIYQREDISTPKMIPALTKNRGYLKKYVNYLGGFPVVIKIIGGSHGIGVMKIDSFSSLFSIVDYIIGQDNKAIMLEFVKTTTSARLIVLGGRVVDSIEYFAPKDEFRSNEGKIPNVRKKKFSKEIQKIAVKGVELRGVEFAGVDILFDKKGKPYVVEVNFPCFFGRSQLLTGVDIAGMMVDYLIFKSNKS